MRDGWGIFARRLHTALKAAAVEVQDRARQSHDFTTRTGLLERSVQVDTRYAYQADVYLNESMAKYGPFVHGGTKPHRIFPKRKEFGKKRRALRWVGDGQFVFARGVRHPGTKADPFLHEALQSSRGEIDRIFRRYVDLTLEEVADSVGRTSYTIR
ncbi:MAG: hypothetical protein E6672_00945 [Negativicoccus succinicivorans]|nr:hypothetical protein [Negativicoccus succinicivorans]